MFELKALFDFGAFIGRCGATFHGARKFIKSLLRGCGRPESDELFGGNVSDEKIGEFGERRDMHSGSMIGDARLKSALSG